MTRWTRALAAMVAAVALAGGGRAVAAEDVTLQVEAGFDGQSPRGAWLPVAVTVEARRLFVGELRVAALTPSGPVLFERAVEVSGGSRNVAGIAHRGATLGHRTQCSA